MKKGVALLFAAILTLSLIQFSFVAAESGSGSSGNDDDSENESESEVEVEVEVEAESNSGSGKVKTETKYKYESKERVGDVRREIRQEIKDGKVIVKERIRNESGEFRQEMKFEADDKQRRIIEFKMKLESNNGTVIVNEMKIKASNLSEEQKEIIAGNINARTGLNLTADDIDGNGTKLRAILSNGRYAEVKVLPNTAARVAVERMQAKCEERNCTVVLKEVSEGNNKSRAVYSVETEKEARALWIFKTKMRVKGEVDSETGEVIRIAKPWWAFLANERNELEEEVEDAVEDMNETEVEIEANASASVNASTN